VKVFCSSIFGDATAYTSNARQRSSFLLLLAKAGKHENLLPLEINNGRVERVDSPAAAWTFTIHIWKKHFAHIGAQSACFQSN